jgi:hypothetical protein
MPFFPLLNQNIAVCHNPHHDLLAQASRECAHTGQGLQVNQYINTATDQVRVHWRVVILPYLKAVLVAKALFCCHATMVWKKFQYVKKRADKRGPIQSVRKVPGSIILSSKTNSTPTPLVFIPFFSAIPSSITKQFDSGTGAFKSVGQNPGAVGM